MTVAGLLALVALVALAPLASAAIVGSRFQGEGMTESSAKITIQTGSQTDDGNHLRWEVGAPSSATASQVIKPSQPVNELQMRLRSDEATGTFAVYLDGTALSNRIATQTPAADVWTTYRVPVNISAGSHTLYVRPVNNLSATERISADWFELHSNADSTPPNTSITSGPADGVTDPDGSFSYGFSGTDDVGITGFECSLVHDQATFSGIDRCS